MAHEAHLNDGDCAPSHTPRKLMSALTVGLALLVVLPALARESSSDSQSVLTCKNIDKIQRVFLSQHIKFKDPSTELEDRTIDQYVKHLDPAKIYLLEPDLAEIKKEMKGVFEQLANENCDALDKVENLYLKRVEERADYAKKALADKKFKFDPKTELTLDPETRQFPKTKTDSDSFHQKYLQFQISNYVATGMKQGEAQEHVTRNYERMVKRTKETTKEDIYSGYLDSFGRALDPHSSYFSRESLEDFEIQMSLSLEGIGATLSSQDGFTTIEQLIDGGSAKASGHLAAAR